MNFVLMLQIFIDALIIQFRKNEENIMCLIADLLLSIGLFPARSKSEQILDIQRATKEFCGTWQLPGMQRFARVESAK